jgi:hypothetical protein
MQQAVCSPSRVIHCLLPTAYCVLPVYNVTIPRVSGVA